MCLPKETSLSVEEIGLYELVTLKDLYFPDSNSFSNVTGFINKYYQFIPIFKNQKKSTYPLMINKDSNYTVVDIDPVRYRDIILNTETMNRDTILDFDENIYLNYRSLPENVKVEKAQYIENLYFLFGRKKNADGSYSTRYLLSFPVINSLDSKFCWMIYKIYNQTYSWIALNNIESDIEVIGWSKTNYIEFMPATETRYIFFDRTNLI